jgi:hypothetical protein
LKTLSCPTKRYFLLSVHLSLSFTARYMCHPTPLLHPKTSSQAQQLSLLSGARALSNIHNTTSCPPPHPTRPPTPSSALPTQQKVPNSSILRPPPPIALRKRESEQESERERRSERTSEREFSLNGRSVLCVRG